MADDRREVGRRAGERAVGDGPFYREGTLTAGDGAGPVFRKRVSGAPALARAFLVPGIAALLALAFGCSAPVVERVPEPLVSTVAEPPFALPYTGAVLPVRSILLPNSPRSYRAGIHEGIDFYTREGGKFLACGEEVFSVGDATVVRADADWPEVKGEEYAELTIRLKSVHDEAGLDRLRGRQVWLRLDDGVVVRYCHLGKVDENAVPGARVTRGERIGAVGNSGTEEGARGSFLNCHLHFEVWPAATAFLGSGMEPAEAAVLYRALFQTSCRAGSRPPFVEDEQAGAGGPGKEGL